MQAKTYKQPTLGPDFDRVTGHCQGTLLKSGRKDETYEFHRGYNLSPAELEDQKFNIYCDIEGTL